MTIQINGQHWVHKTQDEDKQKKNTTQYVLDTTIRKRTQITDNVIITLYGGFVFRHESLLTLRLTTITHSLLYLIQN